MDRLLWYVAYGSNRHAARLDRCLRGGAVDWTSPAPVYLGLREAHGRDVVRTTEYLAARPGVAGRWSRSRLRRLVAEAAEV